MKKSASDSNLDFDGMAGTGVNRSANAYAKNQYTGHSNDGRLVQMNQMPNRKGNDGTCHHSGYAQAGKMPPVDARSGRINGGADCRPFGNPDKINVGQGPRKGNQQ